MMSLRILSRLATSPLLSTTLSTPTVTLNRPFIAYLNAIFNKYDLSRVQEVGPDRAATEWLLRCGASVKWSNTNVAIKDYNALPRGDFRRYKVAEVDATDSGIMEVGFPYFDGLTEFRKLKLVNCKYITDDSVKDLVIRLRGQLEVLEMSDLGSVTDEGVAAVRKFEGLKKLKLGTMLAVKSPEKVLEEIQKDLKSCLIEWPPYTGETEDGS